MEDNLLENQEQQDLVLTEEELSQMFGGKQTEPAFEFKFPPLELDEERITEIVNTKEYIEGEAIGAKLAGMWNMMVGMGMDLGTASALVTNQQTLEYNNDLQKLVNDGITKQSAFAKQAGL